MGNKPPKKVHTSDECIDAAQQKLNIRYPGIIREKLKDHNGFYLAGLRFFPVFDPEDKFHTFDDVVNENQKYADWGQILPEDHVAIANEDHYYLTLKPETGTTTYLYDHRSGELVEEFPSDQALEQWLFQRDRELDQIYREE